MQYQGHYWLTSTKNMQSDISILDIISIRILYMCEIFGNNIEEIQN